MRDITTSFLLHNSLKALGTKLKTATGLSCTHTLSTWSETNVLYSKVPSFIAWPQETGYFHRCRVNYINGSLFQFVCESIDREVHQTPLVKQNLLRSWRNKTSVVIFNCLKLLLFSWYGLSLSEIQEFCEVDIYSQLQRLARVSLVWLRFV